MERKTFDFLATAVGTVLTVVLLVAGGLLLWGYSFANTNVHNQLAQQQIVFPVAGNAALVGTPTAQKEIAPYLNQYAGQPLTTGPQAEAYANHFIAVHLSEMPYQGVYSQVSAAAMADPTNTTLAAEKTTTFQGTTLRGLLLEAYGFWEMGQIALFAAIAAFALAGVMLILVLFGVWHTRRVPKDTALLHHTPEVPKELVTV